MTAEEDGEGKLLPSTQKDLTHEDSQILEDFKMEWLDLYQNCHSNDSVVIVIIIITIRESGDPTSILKVEDMYLELEQLGKVLKTLSESLKGVYKALFMVDITTFCYSQVRYRRFVPFLLFIS